MKGEGYGIEFNANKVRRMIAEKGWTYLDFAGKLGWAGSQLSQVLKKGRARPHTLDYMCYVLGCTIADIMCDDDGISKIKVKLSDGGIMPTRAHSTDAGLDLYSPVSLWIMGRDDKHKCYAEIDTAVHVQIPVGYVGDVKSNSGLMFKYNLTTDGTVDALYNGSIRVKLFNHGLQPVKIEKGQKIAQLVIKKIITPSLELVEELETSERGDRGFGSSGDF
jgi:dUTP pyrophosphatase